MSVEILAQTVVGIIIVPVLQVLKRYTQLTGIAMAWVSFALCAILGTWVAFATGKISWQLAAADPISFFSELGKAGATVFAIATLMYKSIKDRMGLSAKKKPK